ncbi:DNA polymerase Y family protein [Streptomyces roseoviridis]|uniref:UmuC domain-containing protein n=1 Tax=Streptomyces roseoviridis TaxID=67361 RepID=A0ABV5QYL8_9ACTN
MSRPSRTTDRDRVIWHMRCRPDTTPDAHRQVLDLLGEYTPLVQPLPPLAALAQLTGTRRLFGVDPGELAQRARIQALTRLGVDLHIGVSDAWSTSATASARVGRSGVLYLPDHRAVTAFLAPLPVDAVHGIGPAQAAALQRYGLHTVGALAAMDETVVCRILGGKTGRVLRDRARGIDPRTVTAARMPESTSAAHAFDTDTLDPVLVRAALLDLVVTLAERLRGREQTARRVTLAVRLAGGATTERTLTLPAPSAHTDDLRTATFRLLDAMAFQRARLRRLTLIAEDLRPADEGPGTQLSLDPARENRLRLEPVLDRINAKYGHRLAGPAGAYLKAS